MITDMKLYILSIILSISCIQGSSQETIRVDQNISSKTFIGSWESLKRIYPYKSYLIIKNDSTFHFEYGACLASGLSNGK